MKKIKIVPSMALDALCFIEKINCYEQGGLDGKLLPVHKNIITKIEERTGNKLKNGCLSRSALCSIMALYTKNSNFENYTLDDLAKLFQNPKDVRDVVKSKEINEFRISYIYPILDSIADVWGIKYSEYINILKESGFDRLWESDALPFILEEISRKNVLYTSGDISGALADIQRLKQCKPIEEIKIYLSAMSYPVAFQMGGGFLDCVKGNKGISLIYHELMHGFANNELMDLYLEYIRNDAYLTEKHNKLLNEHRSSNEEEFVMAAEYYLRVKHNGEDKKNLLKEARNRYNKCVPTSVFLFDLLSNEIETPEGYTDWLVNVFRNKRLPQNEIEHNLDIVCPREQYEVFTDNLFDCFRKIIAKIKEIQLGESFDIGKKIEAFLNRNFEKINDKSVYFAQERQPLPNTLKIKELNDGNLIINIAEYVSREEALFDKINFSGTNITPEREQINGKEYAVYCVNASFIGKTPVTVSASFIKDNLRVSLTVKCPDYVNCGLEYPSNLKELREQGIAFRNSIKLGEMTEINEQLRSHKEFAVKYASEILAAQKRLEDVIKELIIRE